MPITMRAGIVCIFLAAAVIWLSFLHAAGRTVKIGTIDSVSAEKNSVSVTFSHADHPTEIPVNAEAPIELDNKSAELAALKAGMSVTLEIGPDGRAERIFARTAKDRPATAPVKRPPKPKQKPVAKHKASKTSGRSLAKGKSDKSMDNGLPPIAKFDTPGGELPAAAPAQARGAKWAGSWTSFLGPNRDNVSKETGLLRSWPADGPKLAWKTQGLGQGYSNVVISDGLVLSMGTPDNVESVLAVELETGKPLWSVPTGGPVFREEHGNGPRGTPTLDGECAYALGAAGDLVCVELKTHKLRWHKNIAQEFGSLGLMYGYSESVLIDGNRLICTPGGPRATITALDKGTGEVLWQTPISISPQAAYASPIICDVGVHQYITFLSGAVVGVRAQDGKPLWWNNAAANANAICTTPLLIHDFVFASAAYGAGGALIRLVPQEEGIQPQLVFHTREFQNHHGGIVAANSFVYGADNEILTCLSLDHGRPVWKNRSVGKCSLTYADGSLYVRGEDGPVALVEATPDEYREKGRFTPPKNSNLPAWTYPVVAAGHLFLRDQDDLLCYSLRPD